MMMTILLIALSLALAGALMLLVKYREERARLRAALQADAEKLQWAETSRAALVDAADRLVGRRRCREELT